MTRGDGVAATPRPRRGYSAEPGPAATTRYSVETGATPRLDDSWRPVAATPRRRRGYSVASGPLERAVGYKTTRRRDRGDAEATPRTFRGILDFSTRVDMRVDERPGHASAAAALVDFIEGRAALHEAALRAPDAFDERLDVFPRHVPGDAAFRGGLPWRRVRPRGYPWRRVAALAAASRTSGIHRETGGRDADIPRRGSGIRRDGVVAARIFREDFGAAARASSRRGYCT